MKKILFALFNVLFLVNISAQESETLKLTTEQFETLFINQNLELIAQRMNIDIADATIAQAKLWDNPSFSIDQINFWPTKDQREDAGEMPPLFGSFAKNTQFSLELSQLIQTANKRGKLVNMEKVSKEITIKEFEEVLRNLKTELRKSIAETVYIESYEKILLYQKENLDNLIESYKKQVANGNISKNELFRLQVSVLELENEINETQTELNGFKKNLKNLLNLSPTVNLEIVNDIDITRYPEDLSLNNLFEIAAEARPDVRAAYLQVQYHNKSLAYEKAQRVPDLTLSANYDRFGGVWKDFVGVGISFDIPFLNRNQGNIKAARINVEQSKYMAEQQKNAAQHDITESFNNYLLTYNFYKKVMADNPTKEIDSMFDVYCKNLLNRNISMLEFLDFMDAYRTNKQTTFTAEKKLKTTFEELQYNVGRDIK